MSPSRLQKGYTLCQQMVGMQKAQDDEQREIQQAGLDGKDAFAELKAMAGKGGHMAKGEGLPPAPQPEKGPQVTKLQST